MGDSSGIRIVLGLVASVLEENGFRSTLEVLAAEAVQLGHGDLAETSEFSKVGREFFSRSMAP